MKPPPHSKRRKKHSKFTEEFLDEHREHQIYKELILIKNKETRDRWGYPYQCKNAILECVDPQSGETVIRAAKISINSTENFDFNDPNVIGIQRQHRSRKNVVDRNPEHPINIDRITEFWQGSPRL